MTRPTHPLDAAPADASFACAILALVNHKLESITLLDAARRAAMQTRAAAVIALLDQIECREREDVGWLLNVTATSPEVEAVRAWLTDCWRHGEIVDDSGAPMVIAPTLPVDRFAARAGQIDAAAEQ